MMLCTLADVKTMLGITGTDSDSKLELMIKKVSSEIESYLGYKLARKEYPEELHSVNHRQLISLNALPIQGVSEVTINNEPVTDYEILPCYARWGRLYRGQGWCGSYYTQGMTHDIVSGTLSIKVTYTAGYYLPGDENYTEGDDDSLPYAISMACLNAIVMAYNYSINGAIGIKAHSEGGISDTYGDDSSTIGLSESCKKALADYKMYGVA